MKEVPARRTNYEAPPREDARRYGDRCLRGLTQGYVRGRAGLSCGMRRAAEVNDGHGPGLTRVGELAGSASVPSSRPLPS